MDTGFPYLKVQHSFYKSKQGKAQKLLPLIYMEIFKVFSDPTNNIPNNI